MIFQNFWFFFADIQVLKAINRVQEVNNMIQQIDKFILDQLQKLLAYYGYYFDVKEEDGEECITMGDDRFDRSSVKISVDEKTNAVSISVGKDTGYIYKWAEQTEPGYINKDAENDNALLLVYQDAFLAAEFIRCNADLND